MLLNLIVLHVNFHFIGNIAKFCVIDLKKHIKLHFNLLKYHYRTEEKRLIIQTGKPTL